MSPTEWSTCASAGRGGRPPAAGHRQPRRAARPAVTPTGAAAAAVWRERTPIDDTGQAAFRRDARKSLLNSREAGLPEGSRHDQLSSSDLSRRPAKPVVVVDMPLGRGPELHSWPCNRYLVAPTLAAALLPGQLRTAHAQVLSLDPAPAWPCRCVRLPRTTSVVNDAGVKHDSRCSPRVCYTGTGCGCRRVAGGGPDRAARWPWTTTRCLVYHHHEAIAAESSGRPATLRRCDGGAFAHVPAFRRRVRVRRPVAFFLGPTRRLPASTRTADLRPVLDTTPDETMTSSRTCWAGRTTRFTGVPRRASASSARNAAARLAAIAALAVVTGGRCGSVHRPDHPYRQADGFHADGSSLRRRRPDPGADRHADRGWRLEPGPVRAGAGPGAVPHRQRLLDPEHRGARAHLEDQQDLADRVPRVRRAAGHARHREHPRLLRARARDQRP